MLGVCRGCLSAMKVMFVGIWIIWYMLELARFRTMMACHVDIMDITCENTNRHLMLKGDSYHLLKLYRSTQPSRR